MFIARFSILLLLSLSLNALGAGPQRFDIQDFFTDGKLIATGIVVSGEALPVGSSQGVCGATFDVIIETEILGAKAGDKVKVHHITDYRYPSLEIGSRYFIYAEDKSKHRLINLGDAIDLDLNSKRPEKCHSQSTDLYIYREFTQRIDGENGFMWVGDFNISSWMGIQQITQTRALPRVYSGFHEGKYGMFTESRDYGFGKEEDGVRGGALQLEPVIKLFKSEFKKSLNK